MTLPAIPLENPNPAALFVPGGLEDILKTVEAEARSLVPDVSTAKGRKEINSVAAKVNKTKTYLDGVGKDYVADLKRAGNAVDAVRRDMRDRLDKLRDEVRAPLTEWEQAEEARLEALAAKVRAIYSHTEGLDVCSALEINARISRVDAIVIDESYGEYRDEAEQAKDKALSILAVSAVVATKREEEEREAERKLREAQEERERRIAEEAAERARREVRAEADREAKELAMRALSASERGLVTRPEHKAPEPVETQEPVEVTESRKAEVMANLVEELVNFGMCGMDREDAQALVWQIDEGLLEGLRIVY